MEQRKFFQSIREHLALPAVSICLLFASQAVTAGSENLAAKSVAGKPARGETAYPAGNIAIDADSPRRSAGRQHSSKSRLKPLIEDAAQQYGVEQTLVHAVIAAESAYNSNAVSRAGAIGLMQVMPATAADYGVTDPNALFDPKVNIKTGTRHLKRLLDKYGNDYGRAIMAYNAGEGVVDRTGSNVRYPETLDYTETVVRRYRKFGGRRSTEATRKQIAGLRRTNAGSKRTNADSNGSDDRDNHLNSALLPKTGPSLRNRAPESWTSKVSQQRTAITALQPWREKRTGSRPAIDPAIRFRRPLTSRN
jgi:hypothetical protein